MGADRVLVLGAYGLAGGAIVRDLLAQTPFQVIAAGRNRERLSAMAGEISSAQLETEVLDIADHDRLRNACQRASIVINAVGPFARAGAATARVVVDSGRTYIDCANEQVHYDGLRQLDGLARERGVLMATGAGAIPGWSTLLIAHTLQHFPDATSVDCYWAHLRLPNAESGLASVMGGILEIGHRPLAIKGGERVPVNVGSSVSKVDLPDPFGMRTVVEVPNIDTFTISERFPLRELHSWFYFGDLPIWLFRAIRLLDPGRRPRVYRIIEKIVRQMNARDTAKAIAKGIGPEGLLLVTARNADQSRTASILFRDGAQATARLPVLIAQEVASGRLTQTGLATPLDLFQPGQALDQLGDTALDVRLSTGDPGSA